MNNSRYSVGDESIDQKIADLVEAAGVDPADHGLVRELLVSGIRLGREDVERADLKLVSAALKELRFAYSVFAPYRDRRKVSIFGSARTKPDHPDFITASNFASAMAAKDWMVITGAGPGIMQAGIEGAGIENGFGVGIQLPFEPTPPEIFDGDGKLINFRYFFTRKVTFMRESDAFVALPGGFGTMDEAFELLTLLQTGKTAMTPLVMLERPDGNYWERWMTFVQEELHRDGLISEDDFALIHVATDIDDAVAEVCRFYSNYHSMRFVGGRLIIRMQNAPTPELLAQLNRDFADIVVDGSIEATTAHAVEADDPAAFDLPRIEFQFDKASYGRLRVLIDVLNT